jgi:hypothetical protein
VVHVSGKKNVVADALLRRPEEPGWEPPEQSEEDVDSFIDAELSALSLQLPALPLAFAACPADVSYSGNPLDNTYSEESQELARWILYQKRPEHLSGSKLTKFKKHALQFDVRERALFQIPSGN